MSNSYELLIQICDMVSDVCDKALAELKKLLLRRVEDSTHDTQSAQMLLEMAKDVKDKPCA